MPDVQEIATVWYLTLSWGAQKKETHWKYPEGCALLTNSLDAYLVYQDDSIQNI